MNRIVVVGAGHGGVAAIAALRQFGYGGEIVLVGDEPALPYHRPPLSKAWLKREAAAESLHLRPAAFYEAEATRFLRATHVTAIDRAARTVTLSDDAVLGYDRLILATGCDARGLGLAGEDADNVHRLRGMADADRLAAAIAPGRTIVIAGGGYIGLEVAASVRALGAAAIVVEREPRLLARVASDTLSRYFERLHRANGVDLRTATSIAALRTEGALVRSVVTSDGRDIPCDALLIGVGALPTTALAAAAGLEIGNGVVVDDDALTSDAAIYAIGDVADRPFPFYPGRRGRIESVPNAIEQAKIAAAHICGRSRPAPEVPWFWSDQYATKLQIAGLALDAVETVVRGDVQRAFAVYHLDAARRVRAVEAVNAPADFAAGRLLIQSAAPVDPASLADVQVPIKSFLATHRSHAA